MSDGTSKTKRWIGYVLSALPVLMMGMSSVMKLAQPPMVVEGFAKNHIGPGGIMIIGLVELLCVLLYVIPRTAVLGAVLTTGYLGGAIMTHVMAHETALIAPFILGVLAWAGLYLRDPRLKVLLPVRQREP